MWNSNELPAKCQSCFAPRRLAENLKLFANSMQAIALGNHVSLRQKYCQMFLLNGKLMGVLYVCVCVCVCVSVRAFVLLTASSKRWLPEASHSISAKLIKF